MGSHIKVCCFLVLFLVGCTPNTVKKHYVIAEKLWSNGQYAASVAEFEKVIQQDAGGEMGQQALYRAAMTQTLFLGEHRASIEKLNALLQITKEDEVRLTVEKQIGQILYEDIQNHSAAIDHYQKLLEKDFSPSEKADFSYRISHSQFQLHQYKLAEDTLQDLIKRFPGTKEAENALFDLGGVLFTYGDQQEVDEETPGEKNEKLYLRGQQAFQSFIQIYPKSNRIAEAWFGIGNCLEEQDKLEEALQVYEKIEKTYPSPNVIEIKKIRIKERLAKKSRKTTT